METRLEAQNAVREREKALNDEVIRLREQLERHQEAALGQCHGQAVCQRGKEGRDQVRGGRGHGGHGQSAGERRGQWRRRDQVDREYS